MSSEATKVTLTAPFTYEGANGPITLHPGDHVLPKHLADEAEAAEPLVRYEDAPALIVADDVKPPAKPKTSRRKA